MRSSLSQGGSIEVPEHGIAALLGERRGKSTPQGHSGLLNHEDGEVTDGSIEFMGERIHRLCEQISKRGSSRSSREDVSLISPLENLTVGAFKAHRLKERLDMVYHYFPRLRSVET
jgi:branched-chain amino acid transport system ATP-binding protein